MKQSSVIKLLFAGLLLISRPAAGQELRVLSIFPSGFKDGVGVIGYIHNNKDATLTISIANDTGLNRPSDLHLYDASETLIASEYNPEIVNKVIEPGLCLWFAVPNINAVGDVSTFNVHIPGIPPCQEVSLARIDAVEHAMSIASLAILHQRGMFVGVTSDLHLENMIEVETQAEDVDCEFIVEEASVKLTVSCRRSGESWLSISLGVLLGVDALTYQWSSPLDQNEELSFLEGSATITPVLITVTAQADGAEADVIVVGRMLRSLLAGDAVEAASVSEPARASHGR